MAQLVPCKFYARGSCRFGDGCRFYHGSTAASQETQNFGSLSMLPGPAATYPSQNPMDDTILSILKTMAADMEEWEATIWPFSTYGPIPGRPSIPGTEDLSDDELRYAFMMNGNQYPPELNLEQRMHLVQDFKRNYSHPSVANMNMIRSLLDMPPTNLSQQRATSSNNSTSFGSAPVPTSMSQSPSIFGGNPPQYGGGGTASLSAFNFVSPTPVTPTMEVIAPKTPGFFAPPNTVAPQQSQPTGSPFSSFSFSQLNPPPFLPQQQQQQQPQQQQQQQSSWSQQQQPQQPQQQQSSWSSSFGSQKSGNIQTSTGFDDAMTFSQEEDLEPMQFTSFEANEFDAAGPPPFHPPPKRLC